MIALVILDYCALSLPRSVHATSQEALRFGYFLQRGKRHGARRAEEPPPWMAATDPQGTVNRLTGDIGQFLPLNKLLPLSSAIQLLFSESRRMGYRLEQTDEGYVLTRIQSSGGSA
jgi:hypothetical protein